jgi:hypothetical protein
MSRKIQEKNPGDVFSHLMEDQGSKYLYNPLEPTKEIFKPLDITDRSTGERKDIAVYIAMPTFRQH